MERQLLHPNGQPVVLRHGDGPELGTLGGVRFLDPEDPAMGTKAPRSGLYTLAGRRFRIRQGDPLPEGAVMVDERKQDGAPQNKRKPAAPENRSAGSAPEKKATKPDPEQKAE